MTRFAILLALLTIVPPVSPLPVQTDPAASLKALDPSVFPAEKRRELAGMVRADLDARRAEVHRRDREAWARITSRADWEIYSKPRIAALRRSLGPLPAPPRPLKVHLASAMDRDGYRLENLVYESRPGIFVTANLYLPRPQAAEAPSTTPPLQHSAPPSPNHPITPSPHHPVILLIHSHHNPKTQGELQDMGVTWARAGCLVLVLDQLGYGERRNHAPGNRQDYRFRYINGLQLHALGESLIGWMAWDTMRGIDLLLSRPGADPKRVILIGSVAGGGDPAAVVAALDPRVTCAIPFNFGGPQPETRYPLPDDAETSFNYMGGASWESTRNLRLSGRDGFLPWVVVGSLVPRRLVYAHEFSWDRQRDPVWRRFERLWGLYQTPDGLSFTHGTGLLSGQPPVASHCNNVGPVHRRLIHEALHRWYRIPVPVETQDRQPPESLQCLTPALAARLQPGPAHEVYQQIAKERSDPIRARLARMSPEAQRNHLRSAWSPLLGRVTPTRHPAEMAAPATTPPLHHSTTPPVPHAPRTTHHSPLRLALRVEPDILIPVLLLIPDAQRLTPNAQRRPPVVIGLCQEGKGRFLQERSAEVADLLAAGIAVCLPDVRGTGETAPEGGRGYQSSATSLSAAEWMHAGTMLGARLRDLRSVIRHLRSRKDVDAAHIALWGESFAPVNPDGFRDPLIGEGEAPRHSEPLGALLALFGALYEDDVRAVLARGTLAGYSELLRDVYCYVPHDAVVPGALAAGDLNDIAASLSPRPLRVEGLVNGRNLRLPIDDVRRTYAPALRSYRSHTDRLHLQPTPTPGAIRWLSTCLLAP